MEKFEEEKKIPENIKNLFASEVPEEISALKEKNIESAKKEEAQEETKEYKEMEMSALGEEKPTFTYEAKPEEKKEENMAPPAVQGNPYKDGEEKASEYGDNGSGNSGGYQDKTDYETAVASKSSEPQWQIRRNEL